MKAVIMQPTYLPWIGYFDLMDQGDIFVLLDHVQFSKHSWHQKNRIKTPNGELMLTVPIIRKHPQMINETKINNDQPWQNKHLKSIQANYAKAKYYDKYIGFLEDIYSKKIEKLADLTIPIILWAKEELGIECKIIKSSEINVKGAKVNPVKSTSLIGSLESPTATDLLSPISSAVSFNGVNLVVDICHTIGADEYLSPPGSKEYIDENNIFEQENIKLEYQNYEHPKHSQLWGEFMPYMSVIDLLFNEGGKALDIIRSGRKN